MLLFVVCSCYFFLQKLHNVVFYRNKASNMMSARRVTQQSRSWPSLPLNLGCWTPRPAREKPPLVDENKGAFFRER